MNEPIALAHRIILLRAKRAIIEPTYLFYALQSGYTRADLFARADEALYEAKRGGRNQTRIAGKRNPPVTTSSPTPATGGTGGKRRADAA